MKLQIENILTRFNSELKLVHTETVYKIYIFIKFYKYSEAEASGFPERSQKKCFLVAGFIVIYVTSSNLILDILQVLKKTEEI